jgi:hypothetical protein
MLTRQVLIVFALMLTGAHLWNSGAITRTAHHAVKLLNDQAAR